MIKVYRRFLTMAVSHLLGDDPAKAIPAWRLMHENGELSWPEFVYMASHCACILADRRDATERNQPSEYGKLAAEFGAITDRLGRDFEPAIDARWDQVHAQLETIYAQWECEFLRAGGASDVLALRESDVLSFDQLRKQGDATLEAAIQTGEILAPGDCIATIL